MVILGNEIRLLSVDASTFLGLTKGRSAAEILVTTANSVVLYEVKSQKPLSSWNTSVVENELAVTPCCYDVSNNRFIATFQDNLIRSWTSENDRIERGRKLEAPFPVSAILPLSNGHLEAAVIYENGGISFLNDPSTIIDTAVSQCWGIKSPWASSDESGTSVGFLSIHEQEIILHHFSFDANHEIENHEKYPVHRDGLTFKDAHVNVVQDSLVLSLLWSDGSLSQGKYSLTRKEISWNYYAPLKEVCCRRPVSIISCYDDVILAFINDNGVHLHQELSHTQTHATCVFYNLKFESITTKRILKSDVNYSEIHLYNINEQMFVQLGKDILLLPYTQEISNLSTLLGVRVDDLKEKAVGLDKTLVWSSDGLGEQPARTIVSKKQRKAFSEDFLKLVDEQEKLGKCDQTMCVSLVNVLRIEEDFEKLSEAIRYFQNIPEASLVDCLHSYLSSEIECDRLLQNAGSLETSCHRRYPYIDQIISIPINNVFLLDHLRKLQLDETVWMLWYLKHLLKQQSFLDVLTNPDALQIVDWISMLLDAHFHNFLLVNNKDLCLFLNNLASLVTLQVKELEDVNAVRNSMSLLLTKSKLFERNTRLAYGIETLIFQ